MEEYVCDRENDKRENIDEGKEAECLDDTYPYQMEEDISDINDNNNEKVYKDKEAECIDDTLPYEMEECVYDKNNNKNEKSDEGGKEGETTDYKSTTMDEVKGVII